MKRNSTSLVALLSSIVLAACGGSSSDAPPAQPVSSASWTGTVVGGAAGQSGALSLTFASPVSSAVVAAAVSTLGVTGSLKMVGAGSVSVSGSYDPATHSFTVTGGGFSITGTVGASDVHGSWTGPGASGSFMLVAADGKTVQVLCGSYTGTSSGIWNLVLSGTSARGLASASGGTTAISGSVSAMPLTSGSTLHLTFPAGGGETGSAVSTSVTSAPSVNGTWQVPATGTPAEGGTWSGGGC